MRNNYPQLAYNVLLLFSSTYLCGSAFCTLVSIKSKSRNKLSNVEADLRCAITNTMYKAQNKTACGIQTETKITLKFKLLNRFIVNTICLQIPMPRCLVQQYEFTVFLS